MTNEELTRATKKYLAEIGSRGGKAADGKEKRRGGSKYYSWLASQRKKKRKAKKAK